QEDYYRAIAECHKLGSSQMFIEFMLHKINIAFDSALEQLSESMPLGYTQKLLNIMEYGVHYTAVQLMQRLNLRSRDNFRNLYLRPALDSGLIAMAFPDKPTSRNQAYIRI
nr:Fic family protein [bacterium]